MPLSDQDIDAQIAALQAQLAALQAQKAAQKPKLKILKKIVPPSQGVQAPKPKKPLPPIPQLPPKPKKPLPPLPSAAQSLRKVKRLQPTTQEVQAPKPLRKVKLLKKITPPSETPGAPKPLRKVKLLKKTTSSNVEITENWKQMGDNVDHLIKFPEPVPFEAYKSTAIPLYKKWLAAQMQRHAVKFMISVTARFYKIIHGVAEYIEPAWRSDPMELLWAPVATPEEPTPEPVPSTRRRAVRKASGEIRLLKKLTVTYKMVKMPGTDYKIKVGGPVFQELLTKGYTFDGKSLKRPQFEDGAWENLDIIFAILKDMIENWNGVGTGWILVGITQAVLYISPYVPLTGSSFIDLPDVIKYKRACVNVRNRDQRCFDWSLLAWKHYDDVPKHRDRESSYFPYQNELKTDGLVYPLSIASIPKFERQNAEFLDGHGINVFRASVGKEGFSLQPLRINKTVTKHINLLLLTEKDQSHYIYVKDFAGLMGKDGQYRHHVCYNCLHKFWSEEAYENHIHNNKCWDYEAAKIVLPEPMDASIAFKNHHKQLMIPIAVYADTECLLQTLNEKRGEKTILTEVHKASGVGSLLCSRVPHLIQSQYWQHNTVEEFIRHLIKCKEQWMEIVHKDIPMIPLTEQQEQSFQEASDCHICHRKLGDDRVRDHDHLTGDFRGAAHQACNLHHNFKNTKIPVIFHNLKGYDANLILQEIAKFDKNPKAIAQNAGKYLTFSMHDYQFVDSAQFMMASLERLIKCQKKAYKTLKSQEKSEEAKRVFANLFTHMQHPEVEQLLRKGVFPYEAWTSEKDYDRTDFWTFEQFRSKLNGYYKNGAFVPKDITMKDYLHGKMMFEKFCKTRKDYHDLYLKTDVLLLADVFEQFRSMCHQYYGLDPCWYFTAPGLSWDSMLKLTGCSIDCFDHNQFEMLLMIERGMRGGISMISRRFAKANNPHVSNYQPQDPTSWIINLDANNLYGWAMSQALPEGEYQWDSAEKYTRDYILSLADDASHGAILEVDLALSKEHHDRMNCYPLLPEQRVGRLSRAMKKRTEALRGRSVPDLGKTKKLIPNLDHKEHYVLHYRNLKQALLQGYELTAVHRAITFRQSPWLKRYIDFNTDKRKMCQYDHEKDFFKLMNNAIFGKTCENVRNRRDISLVADPKKLQKMVNQPWFHSREILHHGLAIVERKKTSITYDKPIIVGFCVLELSKVLMYDFHYNTMQPLFGVENLKLLFTDTDSLCYHIKTPDLWAKLKTIQQTHLDCADYPKDHPLYDPSNKKRVGFFKDVGCEVPKKSQEKYYYIDEFAGLRPKMYSILYHNSDAKKTGKGMAKLAVKEGHSHDDYRRCVLSSELGDWEQECQFHAIRAIKHNIYTMHIRKTGLSCLDDKRFVLDDGIETLAHGHYKIQENI